MEPPLEREGKAAKVFMKKPEKNSFEQRLQLTRTVFQLFSFFKKQVPVRIKTEFVDPIYSIMSIIEMVKNIHGIILSFDMKNVYCLNFLWQRLSFSFC